MEKQTLKIKEIIKILEDDQSLCFEPSNPSLNTIYTDFQGGVSYCDQYGKTYPIEDKELEHEIEGRFLEVDG